jgi:hypothetical protein
MMIWKTAFQLSPIYLTGGNSWVAQTIGTTVPLILLTEPLTLISSLISGNIHKELDEFFAHFEPVAGTTLIDNQVSMYPFANRGVAANAMITQPLQISMRMICPVRASFGYALKLATMEALQGTLADHNRSGGTYTVLTPSFFYTDCLMTRMVDVSGGESAQRQHTWQLDFIRPLLSVETAISQGATNPLMSKIMNGGEITSVDQSGASTLTGVESPGASASTGFSNAGLLGPDPTGTSLSPPASAVGNQALEPVFSPGGATIGAQTPGFFGSNVVPGFPPGPVLTPGAFGAGAFHP